MTPEASDTPKRARKARPTADERAAAAALAPDSTAGASTAPPNTLGPAAGRWDQKLAAQASQKTLYEVSTRLDDTDVDDTAMHSWRPVARLEAADAKAAAKLFAESVDEFAGGELRVVPVRNITSVTVGVETRRQLVIT